MTFKITQEVTKQEIANRDENLTITHGELGEGGNKQGKTEQ